MPQIRVFIADADIYLRDKIRQLVAMQGDMRIVDEALTVEEVRTKLPEQHPQILLLDLALPSAKDLPIFTLVEFAAMYSNVILLAAEVDESCQREALHAGATSFQRKTAPAEKLLRAIRLAARKDRRSYCLWPSPIRFVERRDSSVPNLFAKS